MSSERPSASRCRAMKSAGPLMRIVQCESEAGHGEPMHQAEIFVVTVGLVIVQWAVEAG